MNVLIVDPADCTRGIIRSLLTALGITSVAEAATRDEAIAIGAQHQTDLIIADEQTVCSPDGTRITESLHAVFASVPTVMIAASTDRAPILTNAAPRLAKPFSRAELAEAINEARHTKRAA